MSGQSIRVSWNAPEKANGRLMPYRVDCTAQEAPLSSVHTKDNTETSAILKSLIPLKTYECTVTASVEARSPQNQDDMETVSAKSNAVKTLPNSK